MEFEPIPDPREHPWYGSESNRGWRLCVAYMSVLVLYCFVMELALIVLGLTGALS